MKSFQDQVRIKANFKRAKVLVIEDNDDHWILIKRAMQQCLSEVTLIRAVCPEEALALLQEWQYQEWEIPKVIIQDLYVPNRMAGWQLLRQIKQMSVPFARFRLLC